MATIKALEGRTVHQIQSGQVIVDLCSVVKELVENSLDAAATSIEVRFKNNGLESIEVQDNGVGISSENYETIALKHYTSKLSNYDELSSLTTFGFRGEALSSLCALSAFHVITARAEDAPKGTRLDFEVSGKLNGTQVVASQKGSMVAVENLFRNLPVRRRELEKNIKREYGKALGVLQAYACISTNVKFAVSNVMAKGKKAVVFSTKSNPTTRENIANVYGAKALPGLLAMNLTLEMQPSKTPLHGFGAQNDAENKQVHMVGHVSRPIFGEGRQAPDRQMFFVNARPCGLPQVSKVFNEVYKSYNLSQSPFVFANIVLNTNAYDVNVSPDKRTILLHDQSILLESLKRSLVELFERQEQTVPQSHRSAQMLTSFKAFNTRREASYTEDSDTRTKSDISKPPGFGEGEPSDAQLRWDEPPDIVRDGKNSGLIEKFAGRGTRERVQSPKYNLSEEANSNGLSKDKRRLVDKLSKSKEMSRDSEDDNDGNDDNAQTAVSSHAVKDSHSIPVDDFNRRVAEQQLPIEQRITESRHPPGSDSDKIFSGQEQKESRVVPDATGSIVQSAFDRMRPRRTAPEIATITIGSKTTTAVVGSPLSKRLKTSAKPRGASKSRPGAQNPLTQKFGSSMREFAAPGTQIAESSSRQRTDSDVEQSDAESMDDLSDESRHEHTDSDTQGGPAALTQSMPKSFEHAEDGAIESLASAPSEENSDDEFLDDNDKKAKEDAKVAMLIQQAEEKLAMPSLDDVQRAHQILKGGKRKDSTTQLIQVIQSSVDQVENQIQSLRRALRREASRTKVPTFSELPPDIASPEERLSLTVSKEDFSRMHIIGQFNLGFILATRPGHLATTEDELFIIDQHASDEKYNFERLQSSTVVQNQRLVHPRTLELTAIEEEIILENNSTLLKNGFLVSIDQSGDLPVGQRCRLLSLPMSREVTFDIKDLEELIALLADSPSAPPGSQPNPTFPRTTNTTTMQNSSIPRPSKVRRMFAMRACRSSVMVGKPLSKTQMERLVRRMGEIDKPWNCPHGRPTMRHVLGLGAWEGWEEGCAEGGIGGGGRGESGGVDWRGFVGGMKGEGSEEDGSASVGAEE